jgi:hypothetical protein
LLGSFLFVIVTLVSVLPPKATHEIGGLRLISPPERYPEGGVVQIVGLAGGVDWLQPAVDITMKLIKHSVLFFSNDIMVNFLILNSIALKFEFNQKSCRLISLNNAFQEV